MSFKTKTCANSDNGQQGSSIMLKSNGSKTSFATIYSGGSHSGQSHRGCSKGKCAEIWQMKRLGRCVCALGQDCPSLTFQIAIILCWCLCKDLIDDPRPVGRAQLCSGVVKEAYFIIYTCRSRAEKEFYWQAIKIQKRAVCVAYTLFSRWPNLPPRRSRVDNKNRRRAKLLNVKRRDFIIIKHGFWISLSAAVYFFRDLVGVGAVLLYYSPSVVVGPFFRARY